ncbi:MAG: AAA family ATPase [Deltaproteobacteria bacterium]|nr:MAG: AAA family ATPase [Deltaproteobacteria bacterium]
MKDGYYQERIRGVYDYISNNLYLNRPDIEVKGEHFNSAIMFGLLTCLNGGKELIIGEPGLGKTTSAEYVGSILYRYPLGVIWGSEVSGHPEQTEEKIIGRPDLGELNQGKEKVVWSNFAQIPVKVVDEINRLPETKQSMILNGVDRGNWEYLNEILINDEYCLFATANYQDRGTNTIIAPLIDRFDFLVESRHPGPNIAFTIGKEARLNHPLRHPQSEKELHQVLRGNKPHEEKMALAEEICDLYGEYMKENLGVEGLNKEERRKVKEEMMGISFDLDANAFVRMVLAELSFCHRYGQKRSVEACEEGCHYTGYLCHHIKNCASNRLPISVRNYSQALAWFLEDDEVDLEHIRLAIPYTLAHRIQWKDSYLSKKEGEGRNDPFQIYLAKEATEEIFQRYNEQREYLLEALAVGNKAFIGEEISPLDGDHPIYEEIKKDIGAKDEKSL